MSGLIDSLLRKHYNQRIPLEDIKKEKFETAKHLLEEVDDIEEQLKETQKQEAIIKEEEMKNKSITRSEERRSPEKEKRIRYLTRSTFDYYEIEGDVDELFEEFIDMWQKDKVIGVVDFMRLKGIKAKPKPEEKEKNE